MKQRGQKPSRERGGKSPCDKTRTKARGDIESAAKKLPADASAKASAAAQEAPPIVGIGASAGGLEAFTELLRALPTNTGMAFVLVQHLEPRHESILTKLLARATEMPVQEVREGMRIQANNVYVIPANADLRVVDGLLHVVGRRAPAGRHLPIDYFFQSLAEARKSRAIGVILSGTASDGTAGLKAIKVEGGITFAQEPSTARFDGMPRSAIVAGCVDFVLPPARIAAELARIAHHPLVTAPELEAAEALPAKEEDWTKLFRLLQTASGVDFSFYKKSTIKRRLARRMALHKVESIGDYLKFLEANRGELNVLFQDILIHVTSFFRDSEVFTALRNKIFPQILAARAPTEAIRVWASGCSTGQEVYSIAICLLECLGARTYGTPIQIFGTDINEPAVEKARAAIYSEEEMQEVSAERKRRFFTRTSGGYQVNPVIRELCVFARHDVTKDPPFSKIDLISCRNVLIYLEPFLQKKVLFAFQYALKPKGVLMLGKSESLGAFTDMFTITDRKNKFFVRSAGAREPLEALQPLYERLVPQARPYLEAPPRLDLEKEADRIIWDRYAHAGIVVNNDFQILHFRGDTSPYLRPTPGKANFNLSKMVREELQFELSVAVREVRKTGRRLRREGIPLKNGQHMRLVNIEVFPLPVSTHTGKCFLILFDEAGPSGGQPLAPPETGKRKEKNGTRPLQPELKKLQNELDRTRQYLQSVIREHESTTEELKTANEEALSSMEELQSTNEELETAKEELQSSNEELVTLNEQLQRRNSELSRLSDDLSNIISGVNIPIVILDGNRNIRRFNLPAEKLLGLLPGDIGRPLSKLHIGVNIPDLHDLISKVVEEGSEIGREVESADGRWHLLRLRPFRSGERIEGVLMAFVDIAELKQKQDALDRERSFISAVLNAAKDLLVVVLDREGRILEFNRVCEQLTGYSAEEVKGRQPWEFLIPPAEASVIEKIFGELVAGSVNQAENHWITKDGRQLLIGWSNSPVTRDGAVDAIIATGIDHTERAEARQRILEGEATIRALLETAAQAIISINKQGQIVLANATTEKLFGYRRDELIGQPIEQLIPERFREKHFAGIAKWFSRPRNRQLDAGLELTGSRKDGTEFPVDISLSYIMTRGEVVAVGFVSDITDRKKNEQALLEYQEQLRRLTGSLINIQETENRELARELHDVFSQELAALGMEVSNLMASAEIKGTLTRRLSSLGGKIRHLADEMHRASRQLHPAILTELGLEAALREECGAFSEQSGIPVEFTCEGLPASIPEEASLCLYRIAQEGLRNVRKHVGAGEARVQIKGKSDGVSIRVEDTGHGFDVAEARKKGGLGFISMEERVRLVNGKLDVRSKPGAGTTVDVFVPLKKAAA